MTHLAARLPVCGDKGAGTETFMQLRPGGTKIAKSSQRAGWGAKGEDWCPGRAGRGPLGHPAPAPAMSCHQPLAQCGVLMRSPHSHASHDRATGEDLKVTEARMTAGIQIAGPQVATRSQIWQGPHRPAAEDTAVATQSLNLTAPPSVQNNNWVFLGSRSGVARVANHCHTLQ